MPTDKAPTPADLAAKTAPSNDSPATDPAQEQTDWKAKYEETIAESRKWEARAKENKTAAEKLAELEQSQMSEQEKAEARVKAAEQRAAELEAQNARAGVALEYGLSAGDVTLLDGVSEVETMRKIAARLAEQNGKPRAPRPHPAQREGDAIPDDADAIARAFFGL